MIWHRNDTVYHGVAVPTEDEQVPNCGQRPTDMTHRRPMMSVRFFEPPLTVQIRPLCTEGPPIGMALRRPVAPAAWTLRAIAQ